MTIAVVAASVASYFGMRHELRAQVDRTLAGRTGDFGRYPGFGRGNDFQVPPPRFGGAGGYTQFVRQDGATALSRGEDTALPVDRQTLEVAAGKREAFFQDIHVQKTHLRVYVTPISPGIAAQIARPLTEVDRTLRRSAILLSLLGAAGVLLAALLGWLVARAALKPLARLTLTVEEVAATRDLSRRVGESGNDELGRLGARFDDMLGALESAVAAQRQLVADASHELRTPLTTIRMASQVIFATKDTFEPTVARSAELLISQIERFESLLTDLLEVSRFDAQAAVMEVEEIDLVALVKETIDYVHPSQDRIITLQAPNTSIMVDVDPRRIKRIIRNLISNALDHREDKRVDVRIAETDNEVSVGVRDYGSGFNFVDRKMLFERFWRADSSRARSTGGTGLGLSISLEDAKLHQGEIDAWGERGKGAHFVLTIPKYAGGSIESRPISAQL